MATSINRVAVVFSIVIIAISATCRKNPDCVKETYSFTTEAKAYLDPDSININDTIWLEFDQPTVFRDNISGMSIDYSNAANLGFGVGFDKFIGGSISYPGTIPAVSSFSVMVISGTELTSLQPDRIKSYNFSEIGGRYKFKIAIIARNTGIFAIAISNAANVYKRNNVCSKASFTIVFANTNQHLYFYEQNRPGYIPSGYEQTHMYCFKVK